MNPFLIALLALTGCAAQPRAVVDYSEKRLYLDGKTYPVVLGRALGGKPGSYRTPEGTFTVTAKHPRHRYGKALRLGGTSVDGYRQDGRGILVHATRQSRKASHGCVCPSRGDMAEIYEKMRVGNQIKIKR